MDRCKRRVGFFSGVYEGEGEQRLRAHPINCGQWSCPACGNRNARRIYARAMAGEIGKRQGNPNAHKLLTLTLPGQEYRSRISIGEAYKEGSKALTALMKYLRFHLGGFAYLRVCELQQDGYPHWHVILMGDAISPKYVLRMIEDYWRGVCGMGFVKLNRMKEDTQRALRYVLKYLFKEAGRDWGEAMKGARRYQGSRKVLGAVEGKEGKVWVHERVEFRPIGRFVGVEIGRMCMMAKDEVVDEAITTELDWMITKLLGPVLRPITVAE